MELPLLEGAQDILSYMRPTLFIEDSANVDDDLPIGMKKIQFRSLWIMRINAAVRQFGLSYSQFMHGLKLLNIEMDRKQLSYLAAEDMDSFKALVTRVKALPTLSSVDRQVV